MDSRIPKPSGLKKPTANFFDFKSNKSNEADENMKKRPLAGNCSFKFQITKQSLYECLIGEFFPNYYV